MSQQFTNVRLMSGVPFDTTYSHSRWFESKTEQTSYFNSMTAVGTGSNYSYQRDKGVLRFDKPRESLLDVNYMSFTNNDFGNKTMYAFVTRIDYANPGCSFINFIVDEFQTWMFDFTVKTSYVAREHVTLYSNSLPFINTIDEQLNYGTDYDLIFASNFHPTGVNMVVIVATEALGTGDVATETGGSIVGSPSGHNYYMFPVSPSGEVYDVVVDGSSGSSESIGTFRDYMAMISSKEPFLNRVITGYVSSYVGLNFSVNHTTKTVSFTNTSVANIGRVDYMSDVSGENKRYSFFNARNISVFQQKEITISEDVYSVFTSHLSSLETKAYMYPYCVIELTDLKGHVLTIRPEYLKDGKLKVKVIGGIGTSNKVALIPVGYNTDVSGSESYLADFSLIDNDPTEIGFSVDYASAMYQGQRNSLIAQEQNIYNTAGHGYGNTLASTFGAISSAFASGNAFAGLTNIMGSVQQLNNTVMEKENALNLLSGKIKDIDNIPPTVKQMGANSSFSYGNFQNQFYVRYKMIKPEYFTRISNYFKTYGTKTLNIKIPNLHTRRYWNYVQTQNCNITGNINAKSLRVIKNVFDSGITLWHDNDVMNYNRNNEEV